MNTKEAANEATFLVKHISNLSHIIERISIVINTDDGIKGRTIEFMNRLDKMVLENKISPDSPSLSADIDSITEDIMQKTNEINRLLDVLGISIEKGVAINNHLSKLI